MGLRVIPIRPPAPTALGTAASAGSVPSAVAAPAGRRSSRGEARSLPRRGAVAAGATSPGPSAVAAGIGGAATVPASCQLPRAELAASVGLTVLTGQNICHNNRSLTESVALLISSVIYSTHPAV